MYCVEKNKEIHEIIKLFRYAGLWHSENEATVKDIILKLFYLMYYMLLPISCMCGITIDNKDESIFLVESALVISVLSLKLYYVIWKENQICDFLDGICVHSNYDFNLVNKKLNFFRKYARAFLYLTCFDIIMVPFAPFFGSERTLFLNLGFPLDWKNNENAYWIAFTFVLTECVLSAIPIFFSIIIWYILFNCAIKYDVLGNQIRRIGLTRPPLGPFVETGNERKPSEVEKQTIYLGDLIEAIKSYNHIRNSIDQMEFVFSNIFLVQLATSGLCICISIYSLVFNLGDNVMERVIYVSALLYNLFEIFMVTYFCNEITLSSNSMSYCLFQSNWVDQSQSTKKSIIIFGEILKKPQVLVVGKVYPLTLEMFSRILNSAYSMFNILKNVNQR